jgi:hypothetical protein
MLAMLLVSHAMRSTRGAWSDEEDSEEVWEQTVHEYSLGPGDDEDEEEDWEDEEEDWEDEGWDDEDDDWVDKDWEDDDDDDDDDRRRRRQ